MIPRTRSILSLVEQDQNTAALPGEADEGQHVWSLPVRGRPIPPRSISYFLDLCKAPVWAKVEMLNSGLHFAL
jgi:hypothetical protein